MTYMIALNQTGNAKHMWLPTADETTLATKYGQFDTIADAEAKVDELNANTRRTYDRELKSYETHRHYARIHHQTDLRHHQILLAAGEDVNEPIEPYLPDPMPYEQWLTRQVSWYSVVKVGEPDTTETIEVPVVPGIRIIDEDQLEDFAPGSIVADCNGIAIQLGTDRPVRWRPIGEPDVAYTADELVAARGPIRAVEVTDW